MPKKVRPTAIICCEGKTELIFAKYVKSLFVQIKKITVRNLKGRRDIDAIINYIEKQPAEYDEKYIFVDSDIYDQKSQTRTGEEEKKAKTKGIVIIWSSPCLEGVLLKILEDRKYRENDSSEKYKKLFKQKYDKNNNFEKIVRQKFSKDLLSSKRKSIPELDQLIKAIED